METFLKTQRLVLRSAQSNHAALLEIWENTDDYREFVSASKINHHLKFIVYLRQSGKPIGVLYTFSYNRIRGFMFLNIFLEKGYRKMGYGTEASVLAINFIFESLPVYKIYCDVFTTNARSLSMIKAAGLKQEGLLSGHQFYNGTRYDVARFAVYQKDLPRLRGLLERNP